MQTAQIHHDNDNAPAARQPTANLWLALRDWLYKHILEPASKRRQYRQSVKTLRSLDDHHLRDIGIYRGQIPELVRQHIYGPAPTPLSVVSSNCSDAVNPRSGKRQTPQNAGKKTETHLANAA